MTDTKVHPCNVCGKDAVACLSPDIDIKGLCYCEAHRKEVTMVYMGIGTVDETVIHKLMKGWKFK